MATLDLDRDRILQRVKQLLSSSGPLVGLFSLVLILFILSPFFLTVTNVFNIFQQVAVLSILALGGTAVIITGGIDLSVGSVLALSGAVLGFTFERVGLPMPLAIISALAVGALVGLTNGVLITAGRLPPFIATLASLSAAHGLALVVTGGRPISGFPDWFRTFGTFDLFDIIPLSVIVVALLYRAGWAYLRYRPSGRALFAIGGNEEVARLSGLSVAREKMKVYTAAGVLSSIGGLLLAAQLSSVQPTAGTGAELDGIATVVIGGASLSGGVGSVSGTLIGALIIGTLRNGLNLLDVSSFWQQVVIGVVIALAVMIDTVRKPKDR